MASQKNTTKYPKITTEQIKTLAQICALVQDLSAIANATQLAPKLGISKQGFQKHIDKFKKGGAK